MLMNDEETNRLLGQISAVAAFLESASTQSTSTYGNPGSSPPTALATNTAENGARTLVLPRGTPLETTRALTQLGRHLRDTTSALEQHVDAMLVEFFDHLRGKEFAQLSELAERQRVVPEGFRVLRSHGGEEGFGREAPDKLTAVVRRLGDGRRCGVGTATSSPTGHGPASASATTHRGYLGATLSSTSTARFPPVPGSAAGRSTRSPTGGDACVFGNPSGSVGAGSGTRVRQVSAEREMASVLQAHLHLLLESALTQADGTCAAVFIHDAKGSHGGLADGTHPASSTTSTHPRTAGVTHAPRFLHCIAKLNSDGKLPDEVSYASMNALVSVTSTGVAANMANMDNYFAAGLPASKSTASAGSAARPTGGPSPPADVAARHWAVKHLNVRNCVIVPLRRYGCLILADKCPRVENQQANGGRFTMFDEHIAWATALLCDGLLQRYQRSILLHHSWQPPAGLVSTLRPIALLNTIAVEATEAAAVAAVPVSKRQLNAGKAATTDTGFTGKAAEVLAYMDGAHLEHGTTTGEGGDRGPDRADAGVRPAFRSMPTALTMVRTSDDDYNNMVELFSSTLASSAPGAASKSAKAGQSSLSEEDLFGAAADYIQRLETLWRDSLSTANAHQSVIAQYERQLERKDDTIAALETKVQALSMRLVHVEREQAATAAAARSASPASAQHVEPTRKKKSRA